MEDIGKEEFIRQLKTELKNKNLTKKDLAILMGTSRAAIDRLLDPNMPSNIKSLNHAAKVMGKKIQIQII